MTTKKKTIYGALVAAQAKCRAIGKDSTGHGYKYASLPAVIDMLQPILAEEGLALFFTTRNDEALGLLSVATVANEEGESVESSIPIPVPSSGGKDRSNGMQALGSVLTYSRRYLTLNLFNLATDDDDGAAAKDSSFRGGSKKVAHPPKASTVEADRALAMIKEASTTSDMEAVGEFIRESVPEEHRANLKPIFAKRMQEVLA